MSEWENVSKEIKLLFKLYSKNCINTYSLQVEQSQHGIVLLYRCTI